MNIKFVAALLLLTLHASFAPADESGLIKDIIDAKDKSLKELVAVVLKAPPRQFRNSNAERSTFTPQWEQVGDILADKLLTVGGTRFVIGKKFGIEDLRALVELRDWLLSAPPTYFNVCYAVVVELTVSRSSVALMAEKSALVSEIRKLLKLMALKAVKKATLFDLNLKAHPKSAKAKELAGMNWTENLINVVVAAEELAEEQEEMVPATAKELIEGQTTAGLLYTSFVAAASVRVAELTCLYVENGGTVPTDVEALKTDLKAHLSDAFILPDPITGLQWSPNGLANAILAALEKRK